MHGLRRTYATKLYEEGISLNTISEMLRHSSIEETLKYISKEALRKSKYRELG